MLDVLSKAEFKALIKDLEARVEEELKRRQAQKPIPMDEIDMEREAIAAEIATDEEKAQLRATLEHLRDALEQAEARYDAETSPQEDLEGIQDLRDRIEDLESALDKYDPS